MNNNIILIVDPFSTGKLYAPMFNQAGFHCYAIFSSENIPSFYLSSFHSEDFVNKYPLTASQAKEQFSASQICAVVIGSESGVIAGEELANYFRVSANNIITSEYRRNKFKMQNVLSSSNLDSIKTIMISSDSREVSLFESKKGYIIKRIRPYSPWQNGKVERSHREDEKILYANNKFYTKNELINAVKIHQDRYNNTAKICLNFKSPCEVAEENKLLLDL